MPLSNCLNSKTYQSSALHIQWWCSALKKQKASNLTSLVAWVQFFSIAYALLHMTALKSKEFLICYACACMLALWLQRVSKFTALWTGDPVVGAGPSTTDLCKVIHSITAEWCEQAVGKLQMQNANVMTD